MSNLQNYKDTNQPSGYAASVCIRLAIPIAGMCEQFGSQSQFAC